jgi:hypothetical protein
MPKFIEITTRLGPRLVNPECIVGVNADTNREGSSVQGVQEIILSNGGLYHALESFESIKRKLIPVEEPVHSGPGG